MKSLKNKKILITAGPVWVLIDKVRVITNIFRGTLGFLIAKEALKRGAKVTLLLGPGGVILPKRVPKNLKVYHFKFFDELFKLMKKEISSKKYNVVIHSAAVADYAPTNYYMGKISSQRRSLVIHLKPTIKIVDQIKKWGPKVYLVKFKLEVNQDRKKLIEGAYKSMLDSNADLIVANDLKDMKNEDHKAFIINPQKKIVVCKTKKEISKKLLDIISNDLVIKT
ncbi:MAG: phosphopantothenoylcysteine decarboxylase [Patescibacteria group bacterium]|nr:phosphopantothenoylcysteine decarboxylase [Patescibacteria group bacterium]